MWFERSSSGKRWQAMRTRSASGVPKCSARVFFTLSTTTVSRVSRGVAFNAVRITPSVEPSSYQPVMSVSRITPAMARATSGIACTKAFCSGSSSTRRRPKRDSDRSHLRRSRKRKRLKTGSAATGPIIGCMHSPVPWLWLEIVPASALRFGNLWSVLLIWAVVVAVVVITKLLIRMEQHRSHVVENHAQQLVPVDCANDLVNAAIGRFTVPHHQNQGIAQCRDNPCIRNWRVWRRIENNRVEILPQLFNHFFHLLHRENLDRVRRESSGRQKVKTLQTAHITVRADIPIANMLNKPRLHGHTQVFVQSRIPQIAIDDNHALSRVECERERQIYADQRLPILRVRARDRNDFDRCVRLPLPDANFQISELLTREGRFVTGDLQLLVKNSVCDNRNQSVQRKFGCGTKQRGAGCRIGRGNHIHNAQVIENTQNSSDDHFRNGYALRQPTACTWMLEFVQDRQFLRVPGENRKVEAGREYKPPIVRYFQGTGHFAAQFQLHVPETEAGRRVLCS